jgi:hypothetical protein
MTTSATIGEKSDSSSLAVCWQARDAWWKCLDLYDNCEMKCQKQIDQLHHACSAQMVRNDIGIFFSKYVIFRFNSSKKDVRN